MIGELLGYPLSSGYEEYIKNPAISSLSEIGVTTILKEEKRVPGFLSLGNHMFRVVVSDGSAYIEEHLDLDNRFTIIASVDFNNYSNWVHSICIGEESIIRLMDNPDIMSVSFMYFLYKRKYSERNEFTLNFPNNTNETQLNAIEYLQKKNTLLDIGTTLSKPECRSFANIKERIHDFCSSRSSILGFTPPSKDNVTYNRIDCEISVPLHYSVKVSGELMCFKSIMIIPLFTAEKICLFKDGSRALLKDYSPSDQINKVVDAVNSDSSRNSFTDILMVVKSNFIRLKMFFDEVEGS